MQIFFNWPAVGLATLLGVLVHAIWFSPFVFGGLWQRLEGLGDEAVKAGLVPRLGLSLAAAAVQALCLAGFFNFTQSNSFGMGVLAALQLGLGLVAPAVALVLVMGGRKPALLGLHLGALLVSQALCGGLLAAGR